MLAGVPVGRRQIAVVAVLAAVLLVVSLWWAGATRAGNGPTASAAAECGVERWPVKTLSDKRVNRVDFHPHDSSIGRLRKKDAPHVGSDTPRIDGMETTNYRVRARLIEFKLEEDKDIHLVIGLPSSPEKTMIVEFPDITCPGARRSPKKTQMARARSALVAACGQPSSSSFHQLQGTATVTGVGFFDILHGQTGVAPNGIELHPVLRLAKLSCQSQAASPDFE
jgi:hypothetical protein